MKAPSTNSAEPRRGCLPHRPPGRTRTSVPWDFRERCRAIHFVRASGAIGAPGLGALRYGGPPWRARVSGCGAGARRACALPPAVPGAPLSPRPRVSDQTPVPARSQTTLLSCQFSRLSAELLVSDRKQRGGGTAAWLGRERPGGGAAGRPRAGGAGGAWVHGLRVGPPSPGPPSPASAPPRLTPLLGLPFSLSPFSPPLLPTRSSLSPPAVLQLPNCSLPWLCLRKKKKKEPEQV